MKRSFKLFEKYGFSGNSDFFQNLGVGIGKALFIISSTMGTVLLTIGGAYAGSFDFDAKWTATTNFWDGMSLIILNPVTALISGVATLFFGAIGTYKDQNRQKLRMFELDQENQNLKETKSALNSTQEELQESKSRILRLHGELVKTWLKGLSKFLELDSKSRVTVYYEHDEEFYLLKRHSKNPKYSKVHQQKFPLNQGVISKAWEHGEHKEDKCPVSSSYEKYKAYMNKTYGYDKTKIDSLTMKSCRYYAKAIIDADIHVGVILYESTNETTFMDDLESKFDSYCQDHQGQLSKFVRDSLNFDREVNIKRQGKNISVEDDFLELMKKWK
jgi:hypothetical protein